MKSIYNINDNKEIIDRILQLTPISEAKWGKMNSAQMLNHCKLASDVAFGKQELKMNFAMKILGKMLKKKVFYGDVMKKNSPTAKEFIITNEVNFENAKTELIINYSLFASKGKSSIIVMNHPFWGKMTHEDWDALMFKHLDHHLKQFGV